MTFGFGSPGVETVSDSRKRRDVYVVSAQAFQSFVLLFFSSPPLYHSALETVPLPISGTQFWDKRETATRCSTCPLLVCISIRRQPKRRVTALLLGAIEVLEGNFIVLAIF